MPECDGCGEPLEAPRDKDKGGWWRDYCLPCIGGRAYSPAERTSIEEILEGSDYAE